MLVWSIPGTDQGDPWRCSYGLSGTKTPLRQRPVKSEPSSGVRLGSAVRQTQNDGLLERLMASSPKPPRWARTSNAKDLSLVDGVSQSPAGKWARMSMAGNQVRSTSELPVDEALKAMGMAESFEMCTSTVHEQCLGSNDSEAVSNGDPDRQLCTESDKANRMIPKRFRRCVMGERSLDKANRRESGYWPTDRSLSADPGARTGQASSLPPMPCFPPPEIRGQDTPRTPSFLNGTCTAGTSIETSQKETPRGNAAQTLEEQLRLRVQVAHGRRVPDTAEKGICAGQRGDAAENIPPNSRMSAKTDAHIALLRATARKLHLDVVQQLHPGPEVVEVDLLLRRVQTLLSSQHLIAA